MNPFEVWRRNLWLWLLPVGFCLLNLLANGVYHLRFSGDVERLEERYETKTAELEAYRDQHQQIAEFLGKVEDQQEKFDVLYDEHFQTESRRFTRAISEVKRLVREAGLNPASFNYPRVALGTTGLVSRQINFSVQGTYKQLRTFINFLELSDQFLALQSVSLSEATSTGNNPTLSMGLQVSTIFVESEQDVEGQES